MNIVFSLLILTVLILTLLAFVALIFWWRGADNILFPGLGLVVAMPGIIVLLFIISIAVTITASFIKPRRNFVDARNQEQKFEYPNDIFAGCGNGTLTVSVAKDPKNWGQHLDDHHLKVCINYDDLDSIREVFAPGIIKLENHKESADRQKILEQNKKILEKFALDYPIISRVEDMYEDYIFSPVEVKRLREECLKMQNSKPDSATDLALRKFIYICDKALEVNSSLIFSGD